MKIFNKKKLAIVLASVVMGVCAIFAAGCGKKVEQINITKSNAPQNVFVLGNDLDFSDGKLTVVIDGEKSEVALNDPAVTVEGYNKDKLGEQTLTISYEGQTTTFKVTVVPRLAVAKYDTAYFVGEPFNQAKGQVTVTGDDGESTIVEFKDPEVEITGYDSTMANAELPLTLTYTKGADSYETTFNVAIYEATTVKFNAPSKKAYKNHETGLDVTGGYIALENENFSKYVTITKDMVAGFDLSAAGVEHRSEPLVQTLTVDYCGYQKTYDIQIKFSDYSLVMLRSNEMSKLTWNSTSLPSACTETMGENAMEAMDVLFNSEDDLSQVTEEAAYSIVKVAAVYGLDKWQKAFDSYSDAFYINESGSLSWNCENFESTQTAYNKLLNKDPIIYNDAAVLVEIAEKYGSVIIYDEATVAETLSVVYSPDMIDSFIGQLALMIDLHLALKDVPGGLSQAELQPYATQIEAAWTLLHDTEFKATNYRTLYLMVSRWREQNDYFEILYTFYYNPEDFSRINAFKDLRLPGALETLYSLLLTARSELVGMQQGYRVESTTFMYCYEEALKLKTQILASGNEVLITLYENLKFDYLLGDGSGGYELISFDQLFHQFRRTTNGYLQNFNTFLGVKSYEDLYDAYIGVIEKASVTEGYFESDEYAADAEGLLAAYMSLSPKQQFSFMVMLQPYYMPSAAGRYPLEMWTYDGETYQNQFTFLIYNYYDGILSEEAMDIFVNLMLANETIANLQIATYIDFFFEYMSEATDIIDRISVRKPDDWAQFNDVLGWLLLEMETYYDKFEPVFDNGTMIYEELTDAERKDFEELLNATYEAYSMLMVYQTFLQQGRANLAIAFYAPMEKVEALSAKILASENPRVLRAYYFDDFYLEGAVFPDGSVANFGASMDFLVWLVRQTYTQSLTGMSYLSANDLMYDAYSRINIKEYLAEASYLYFTYIYMNLLPSSDEHYVYFEDVEQMMEISRMFREDLTDEQRYFALVLDNSFQMYRNAMFAFAKERNAKMASLAQQLISVEYMYVYYTQLPDGEDEDGQTYKAMLLREYELLLEDYQVLSEEVAEEAKKSNPDQAKLNAISDFETYFGDMYEHYQAKCEAIKAQA